MPKSDEPDGRFLACAIPHSARYSQFMSDPAPVIDEDLYCLECGYNLRGLSGDPVRCPECGNLNPLGVVGVPSALISKQLRRLENEIGDRFLSLLIAIPLDVAFCWGLLACARDGFNDLGILICVGLVATITSVYWLRGCMRFRRRCGCRSGWLRALVMYHVWSSLRLFLVVVPVTIYLLYGEDILRPLEKAFPGDYAGLAYFAGLGVLVLAIAFGTRRLRGLATAPLVELQYGCAAELARAIVQRDLSPYIS